MFGIAVDSTGSGIPDAVEAMEFTMPTGGPGVAGTPLDLDPTRADTSGDGLRDEEQVEIDWGLTDATGDWELVGNVAEVEAHPARVDSTGDGLTDRQQLEGWEIQYTKSANDTAELLDSLQEVDPDATEILGDEETDPTEVMAERRVYAEPLAEDTSQNGIDDIVEFYLGLDPERTDTTGDGLADADALAAPNEDPTLYSNSPPEITIDELEIDRAEVEFDPENGTVIADPSVDYDLEFTADDPSGIASTEVTKFGKIRADGTYPTMPSTVEEDVQFTLMWERLLSILQGDSVAVHAEDRYGNTERKLAYSDSSFYGTLAAEFDYDSPMALEAAMTLGLFSGFTHGTGDMLEFLNLIMTESYEVWQALKTLAWVLYERQELLADLFYELGADVRTTQQLENPHAGLPDEDSWLDYLHIRSPDGEFDENVEEMPDHVAANASFASGWYLGYLSFHVLTMYLGSPVLKAVDTAEDFGTWASRAARNIDQVESTLRTASRVTPDVDTAVRWVGLANAYGVPAAGKATEHLRTVGQQARVYQLLSNADGRTIAALEGYERHVAEFVIHNGGRGVWALNNRIDRDEEFDPLFDPADEPALVTDGGQIQVDQKTVLSHQYQTTITEAEAEYGIRESAVDEAVARIDRLDGNTSVYAMRFVTDVGPESVETVAAFDSNQAFAETVTGLYEGRSTVEEGQAAEQAARMLARDIPTATVVENMAIEGISYADGMTTIRGDAAGVSTRLGYPTDGERYLRTDGGLNSSELPTLDEGERGDVVEQHVAPTLLAERGLPTIHSAETDEPGFDVVAYDDATDEYVIVEAKFTNSTSAVGTGLLDDPELKARQMTDQWVNQTIENMQDNDDPELVQLGNDLEEAMNGESKDEIRKEMIVVQNTKNGRTVSTRSPTLHEFGIEHVHIVKIGEVVEYDDT